MSFERTCPDAATFGSGRVSSIASVAGRSTRPSGVGWSRVPAPGADGTPGLWTPSVTVASAPCGRHAIGNGPRKGTGKSDSVEGQTSSWETGNRPPRQWPSKIAHIAGVLVKGAERPKRARQKTLTFLMAANNGYRALQAKGHS